MMIVMSRYDSEWSRDKYKNVKDQRSIEEQVSRLNPQEVQLE
jgi:hypothetical protein